MQYKKLVACASATILAFAVACSKGSETPVSPSAAQPGVSQAGPNGETLKATAPTPQSPVNNAQPDQLVLTAGKSSGTFDQSLAGAYSYEFQIMNAANAMVCTATVGGGSGSSVAWTPACTLEFDQPHSWRVRAVHLGAVGPWSSSASFRSPAGGYIRGSEIFDPLYNSSSVGQAIGTTFIPGVGVRLNGHDSRITYQLPETLQSGEISVMVTGIDEGNPGDKTKIFSMQEGGGDLTTNDYRMTAEKRGRSYDPAGAVTFRIIMGEADDHGRIFDGDRFLPAAGFSDERWYFWKFTWNSPGRAALEVRQDGPNGNVIYFSSRGTGGYSYRPVPHIIHLGASVGRAGPADASIPGAIYKHLWVSGRPRPNFPTVLTHPE